MIGTSISHIWILLVIFIVKAALLFCFVQPTGENGATRAPIVIDMERDDSLTSKGLLVQIENKTQQVSASKHHSCKCIMVILVTLLHMHESKKEILNG